MGANSLIFGALLKVQYVGFCGGLLVEMEYIFHNMLREFTGMFSLVSNLQQIVVFLEP